MILPHYFISVSDLKRALCIMFLNSIKNKQKCNWPQAFEQ